MEIEGSVYRAVNGTLNQPSQGGEGKTQAAFNKVKKNNQERFEQECQDGTIRQRMDLIAPAAVRMRNVKQGSDDDERVAHSNLALPDTVTRVLSNMVEQREVEETSSEEKSKSSQLEPVKEEEREDAGGQSVKDPAPKVQGPVISVNRRRLKECENNIKELQAIYEPNGQHEQESELSQEGVVADASRGSENNQPREQQDQLSASDDQSSSASSSREEVEQKAEQKVEKQVEEQVLNNEPTIESGTSSTLSESDSTSSESDLEQKEKQEQTSAAGQSNTKGELLAGKRTSSSSTQSSNSSSQVVTKEYQQREETSSTFDQLSTGERRTSSSEIEQAVQGAGKSGPSNSRKLLIALGVIVALLGVGGGGVFGLSQLKEVTNRLPFLKKLSIR